MRSGSPTVSCESGVRAVHGCVMDMRDIARTRTARACSVTGKRCKSASAHDRPYAKEESENGVRVRAIGQSHVRVDVTAKAQVRFRTGARVGAKMKASERGTPQTRTKARSMMSAAAKSMMRAEATHSGPDLVLGEQIYGQFAIATIASEPGVVPRGRERVIDRVVWPDAAARCGHSQPPPASVETHLQRRRGGSRGQHGEWVNTR
eukprot:6206496-Pleurochrysis_carterae.AAC.2